MLDLSLPEALNALREELESELQKKLSELLETKHLYQRVKPDYEATTKKYEESLPQSVKTRLPAQIKQQLGGDIELVQEGGSRFQPHGLKYILKNVKLYCPKCKQREVFGSLWAHDLSEKHPFTDVSLASRYPRHKNYQGLFLAYQCLRCKDDPTLFIVRREDWSFILEGRSPIEQVEVPSIIPNSEQLYFRESIVAFQSGKPLAGILYLESVHRTILQTFNRNHYERVGRSNH